MVITHMDTGNGFIGYYTKVTAEQLKRFVAKRGCERIVFRQDGNSIEMSYQEFKEIYMK